MRTTLLQARVGMTLVGLLAPWMASAALATIPYGGLAPGIPGGLGPDLAKPSIVPGKEYSHDFDSTTIGAGAVPPPPSDFDQVVAWDGSGGTADGLDYSFTRPDLPEHQVDAIANRRDHLFVQLLGSANQPEPAHLIFSHDDQISAYFSGLPPAGGSANFTPITLSPMFSGGPFTLANGKPIGGTGELSYEKAAAFAPPSDQGRWATQGEINGMPLPLDIDGVEVWGPEPALKADAEKYSLNFDAGIGMTSVWSLHLPTNTSTPYITHLQIVNAVTMLLGPVPNSAVLPYPTFIDGNAAINLDALMVQDIIDDGAGGPDTFDRDPDGGIGDRIIFSIRQIPDTSDPDGYYATGSELFVLDASQPNAPTYLHHGGHLWDQAYALANFQVSPNLIDGGIAVIDVNAIEAISQEVVPEPASMLLIVLGLAVISAIRTGKR